MSRNVVLTTALLLACLRLSLASEPYDWQPAVMTGGGYVTGVHIHPRNAKVMYMRTDMGGAYRLDADKNEWIPLLDWVGANDYSSLHGIAGIALDPADDNKVYLLTGMYLADWGANGAILKSSDRGATWKRFDLPFKNGSNWSGRWCSERIAIDPRSPDTLVIGTYAGHVYKSTDAGETWAKLDGFPKIDNNGFGVAAVEFASGGIKDGSAIYAGVNRTKPGESLYRSADGGATWSELKGRPSADATPFLLKMVRDADDNLLLIYANSSDSNLGGVPVKRGALYRFNTKTDAWTLLHETQGYGIGAVAADPKNARVLMITSLAKWSGNLDLWRSEDAGKTWKPIKVKRVGEPAYVTDGWPYPHWMTDIDISPADSNDAIVCGVPGAYRSSTASADNQTWRFFTNGVEEAAVSDLVSPPSGNVQVYSAVLDIAGFAHEDVSISPPDFSPEMDGCFDIDFAQADPKKMVRTGLIKPFGAYSEDGGAKWTAFAPIDKVSRGGTAAIAADGAAIVWSPNGTPSTYRSSDGGKSFAPVEGIPGGAMVIADRVSAGTFYAIAKSEFYRSTDAGASFSHVGAVTKPGRLVAHPSIEGLLLLTSDTGLRRSTDGGKTWSPLTNVSKAIAVGFGKAKTEGSPMAIYLSGTVDNVPGVYRSDDDGATWIEISDAQHRFGLVQAITGDPRRYGRVYLGTNGRGIMVGDPKP